MRKIHIPNHKLYEQYYLDEAKQKGGNLPAFYGARFQRGYGLGSIFKGIPVFRWAVYRLQQGAKMLGKKALQGGVNVAQDVHWCAIGDLLPQAGAGRKAMKRKTQFHSSTRNKKRKTTPWREGQENFELWS